MARFTDIEPSDEQRGTNAKALADAMRRAAGVVADSGGLPLAGAVAGVRSLLPGGGPFSAEMERYQRGVAPGITSPTSVIPEVRESEQGERAGNLALGMAGPLRVVGPRFNPRLFHGSNAEVRRFDPARYGEGAGNYNGQGFYTTPKSNYAAEYADNLEGPQGVVNEYRLNPGEKVFETAYKAADALPEDVAAIKEWLHSQGQEQVAADGFHTRADELLRQLEGSNFSEFYIDAAHAYANAQGAKSVSFKTRAGMEPGEFIHRDPDSLRFVKARYLWRDPGAAPGAEDLANAIRKKGTP